MNRRMTTTLTAAMLAAAGWSAAPAAAQGQQQQQRDREWSDVSQQELNQQRMDRWERDGRQGMRDPRGQAVGEAT